MCGSKIFGRSFWLVDAATFEMGRSACNLSRVDATEAGRARCRIGCKFQNFVRAFVERLVASSMESFEVRGLEQLDPEQGYLFVSNHRDIAGDSMLLNLALHRHGLGTVRIAVGDNLIEEAYATDLMRLNKSFFINRTGLILERSTRTLRRLQNIFWIRSPKDNPCGLRKARDGLRTAET